MHKNSAVQDGVNVTSQYTTANNFTMTNKNKNIGYS